ncbi:MAG TPA: helix-turn-helix domain-containing protein [Dehalococcoidia bacterium]|nr:helix-turn-helix domain-containing protein [Dehalococcoidia bacterium]
MTEERLLTVREVARLCHRSEETVRRWIWSGKLPARKLGNQLFITEGEISRLQQGQRISETKAEYRASRGERSKPLNAATKQFFEKYGYVPTTEALREHRGQISPNKEDALKHIDEDEAFQKEILARYGPVDVVALITEPAPRLTERQYSRLETREKKLRKALLERHGYVDAAELVRRSRGGH